MFRYIEQRSNNLSNKLAKRRQDPLPFSYEAQFEKATGVKILDCAAKLVQQDDE